MADSKVPPTLVRDRNHADVEWYARQNAMTIPEVYRQGAALLINMEAAKAAQTQETR